MSSNNNNTNNGSIPNPNPNEKTNLGISEISMMFLGTNSALPTTETAQSSLSTLLRKSNKKKSATENSAGAGSGVRVRDDDMSSMDAAQASLLLKRTHGMGKNKIRSSGTAGGSRHRRLQNIKSGGQTVIRDYHKLDQDPNDDLSKKQQQQQYHDGDNDNEKEEDEKDSFRITSTNMKKKGKKQLIHFQSQQEQQQQLLDHEEEIEGEG